MLVKNILGQTIDIPEASYQANKNAFTPIEEVKTTDLPVEEVKTTVMKKK